MKKVMAGAGQVLRQARVDAMKQSSGYSVKGSYQIKVDEKSGKFVVSTPTNPETKKE